MDELQRYAESDVRWFLRGLIAVAVVLIAAGFGMYGAPALAMILAPLLG